MNETYVWLLLMLVGCILVLAAIGLGVLASQLGEYIANRKRLNNISHNLPYLKLWAHEATARHESLAVKYFSDQSIKVSIEKFGITTTQDFPAFDSAGVWRDQMAAAIRDTRKSNKGTLDLIKFVFEVTSNSEVGS